MNIPTIPGLSPHPTQIAETERLAYLRRMEPAFADGADQRSNTAGLLSDKTRQALRKLSSAMRKANGKEPAKDLEPNPPAGSQGMPDQRVDLRRDARSRGPGGVAR